VVWPRNPRADEPRKLKRWQAIYFAAHPILGRMFDLVLLEAMADITQKG
jgi:hypothetical protein